MNKLIHAFVVLVLTLASATLAQASPQDATARAHAATLSPLANAGNPASSMGFIRMGYTSAAPIPLLDASAGGAASGGEARLIQTRTEVRAVAPVAGPADDGLPSNTITFLAGLALIGFIAMRRMS